MRRRSLCLVIACAMMVCCLGVNAGAVTGEARGAVCYTIERASGKFSMDIPADTLGTANISFPLEAGETVSINAVYSPKSASVKFGLIAPDGLFYSVEASNGSFDKTIKVDERGNYTFAVKNNSSETVSVSGFVNY